MAVYFVREIDTERDDENFAGELHPGPIPTGTGDILRLKLRRP
jgi:hypothetical protein